jgi:hypothetical protein
VKAVDLTLFTTLDYASAMGKLDLAGIPFCLSDCNSPGTPSALVRGDGLLMRSRLAGLDDSLLTEEEEQVLSCAIEGLKSSRSRLHPLRSWNNAF